MATLEQYSKMLLVSKHRLDDELELQAEVMMRIGDELALRDSRMIEAKDEIARTEGRLVQQLKEEDPGATVVSISGQVTRHRDRIRAYERWMEARAEQQRWSNLYEAWKERGFAIKALGGLYNAQYFSLDKSLYSSRAESPAVRERSENELAEGRAALRRASQGELPGTRGDNSAQREEPADGAPPRRRRAAD